MNTPFNIYFYQRGTPCHGDSVRKIPLGGTESAMIFMAEALADRGHHVFIFNEVDKPGVYRGVTYRSWKEFESLAEENPPDIFICVRHLLPLMAKRWAPLQIYFSPDAADQPFVNGSFLIRFQNEKNEKGESEEYELGMCSLAFAQQYADVIFCVGHWQSEIFCEKFRIPKDKIFIASNGVNLSDFHPLPLKMRKPQIAYCSTPFRGLEYLLRIFPHIRARVPEATCVVMSGMQLYGLSAEEDRKTYQSVYDLAQQPGVILHPPLPKLDLAKILCESRVLAYPNTFAETFCIAALEAQAAGLPIVTTKLAGLQERVSNGKDGYLIQGHPSQETYQEEFIEKTVQLLTDDPLWSDQSEQSLHKAATFSYDKLAKEWEVQFQKLLATSHEKKEKKGGNSWVPTHQVFNILANGSPKKIELSEIFLKKYYQEALSASGFEKCAERMKS